ncbi:hypothetical protein ACFPRL_22415 [Pseudoclavibacter helvolus]
MCVGVGQQVRHDSTQLRLVACHLDGDPWDVEVPLVIRPGGVRVADRLERDER